MRASERTDETAADCRIVARPPLTEPPFDRKESLPVSRIRVCVGLLLLVHHLRCWRPKFLLPCGQVMGVCRLCSANRVQLLGSRTSSLTFGRTRSAKTVSTPTHLTNRGSQRPHYETPSECLPRHPVVADLVLVRRRTL